MWSPTVTPLAPVCWTLSDPQPGAMVSWEHGTAWNSRSGQVLRAAFVLHKELVSAKQVRPKDGLIQQKMVVYPTEYDEI